MRNGHYDKTDIFPIEPYKSQGKTVHDVMIRRPAFVEMVRVGGKVPLTAEARISLNRLLPTNRTATGSPKNTDDMTLIEGGSICGSTDKAVRIESGTIKEWVPRRYVCQEGVKIYVTTWMAKQKGLVS